MITQSDLFATSPSRPALSVAAAPSPRAVEDAVPLQIAANLDAFNRALFTGPRTFDGFIRRKIKGGIRLFILGEYYTLNRDGVFCFETKQTDGRTWYSYGGNLNKRTIRELSALAETIRAIAENDGRKPKLTAAAH